MARDMPCDVCGVMIAERLVGNLTNGEQTALCAGCQVVWMLSQLEELLNDDAKRLVAERWAPAPAAPAPAQEPVERMSAVDALASMRQLAATEAEVKALAQMMRADLLAMGAPADAVDGLDDDQVAALLDQARAAQEGGDQVPPKRRPRRRRRAEPAGDDSGPAEAPPEAPEAATEAAADEPNRGLAEAPATADDA